MTGMTTREDFDNLYKQGPDAVFAFVAELEGRLKVLEDRLGKDSHNSSKPPSTDGFKKKPKSLRPNLGRSSGGQLKHPGRTLDFTDKPDSVVVHRPVACEDCGTSLDGVDAISFERRQVSDLPPIELVVTEHRLETRACPKCGKANSAPAPEGVDQPVQYGARVRALIIYLLHVQLLPYRRTADMMADVFGAPLSEGTLANTSELASKGLAEVETAIVEAIKEAPIVHMDETSQNIGGKRFRLHVACTTVLTFYMSHVKRGKAALDAIGILAGFTGRAIHDGLSAYRIFDCEHGLCNAHHLRELICVHEQYQQQWAADMVTLLVEIKRAVAKAKEDGKQSLGALWECRFEGRYRKLLKVGYKANPPPAPSGKPGRTKQGVVRCLLLRLTRNESEVLAFMHDFSVPFDNNQAERDLRMMKLKQKVSGGFRSEEGAKQFCRIRGYVSTLRKQGINVLEALHSVFLGKPIMPNLTPE